MFNPHDSGYTMVIVTLMDLSFQMRDYRAAQLERVTSARHRCDWTAARSGQMCVLQHRAGGFVTDDFSQVAQK